MRHLLAVLTAFGGSCGPDAPAPVVAPTRPMAPSAPESPLAWSPALPPLLPPLPPPPPLGPLSGLLVFLSPGHGLHVYYAADHVTPVKWGWQRAPHHGVQEDRWTADFCSRLLAPALEAAGATVLSLRELDPHREVQVVDDADDGFTASVPVPDVVTDDLTEGGRSAVVPIGHHATWTLTAPASGRLRLATRWSAHVDHDPEAHYVIETLGAAPRRVDVDQTRHGGVWWPLGEVEVEAGEPVTVTLRGSGRGALSADAVRIGGGEGRISVPELGVDATFAMHDLAASQHVPHLGGPLSLLELPPQFGGGHISDMRLRARWTAWASDPQDEAVYLSIHTNAGGARGTVVYFGYDPDAPRYTSSRPASRNLATTLTATMGDALHTVDPAWPMIKPYPGNYSEISPWWNDVDGALIEVGFHDSATDASRLVRQDFQEAAVRGILTGLVGWRTSGRLAPELDPSTLSDGVPVKVPIVTVPTDPAPPP